MNNCRIVLDCLHLPNSHTKQALYKNVLIKSAISHKTFNDCLAQLQLARAIYIEGNGTVILRGNQL